MGVSCGILKCHQKMFKRAERLGNAKLRCSFRREGHGWDTSVNKERTGKLWRRTIPENFSCHGGIRVVLVSWHLMWHPEGWDALQAGSSLQTDLLLHLKYLDLGTVKVWEVCRASLIVLCWWWYDHEVNLASLSSGKLWGFLIYTKKKKKKKSKNTISAGLLLHLTPSSSPPDAAWPDCLVNIFYVFFSRWVGIIDARLLPSAGYHTWEGTPREPRAAPSLGTSWG